MAFEENLSDFFDSDQGFAVDALVGGVTVSGIYDSEYVETSRMSGFHPVFTCEFSKVATVKEGAAVVVPDEGAFTVAFVEKPVSGVTRIVLRKA